MGLLDGKVAIITGAGGGLGEAYAKLFAREGAAVVVNDLGGARDGSGADVSAAQKVVNDIVADGGRAVANGDDVSTMEGGENILKTALDNFGQVDILVCNAAVNPYYGPLLDISDEAFDKIMGSNVKSNIWLCGLAIPQMAERGGGSVSRGACGAASSRPSCRRPGAGRP